MVHSVISYSLSLHGKGCCDPSTIGDYTLSFNRLYFFVLYSERGYNKHPTIPKRAAVKNRSGTFTIFLSITGEIDFICIVSTPLL
jgi:hypothetical protein